MEFLSRAQVITALGAVLGAFFVLDLVRRRRLSEEYSLLWVVASIVVAVLGISTPLLRGLTRTLGIMYEGSTVFFVGLAFAMAMLLYLSIKLSRLGHEHQIMAREIAFLRLELERRGGDPDSASAEAGQGGGGAA